MIEILSFGFGCAVGVIIFWLLRQFSRTAQTTFAYFYLAVTMFLFLATIVIAFDHLLPTLIGIVAASAGQAFVAYKQRSQIIYVDGQDGTNTQLSPELRAQLAQLEQAAREGKTLETVSTPGEIRSGQKID